MNDVAGKVESEADETARLLANRAKREAAIKAAAEKRDLDELRLEEKYSEKLGARGIDFEIINTAKGLFVVRKPDYLTAKRFNAIPVDKMSDEDVWAYVTPSIVEPASDIARATMQEHGGIAHRCAAAMHSMYGGNGPLGRSGKF